MSKMGNVDLCKGCVRNGGYFMPECTRCKFDEQAVESIDMAQVHSKHKAIGYNRRQQAIKAKARADMALQVAISKSTALSETRVTEAHARVGRKLKNAAKQVHRIAVIEIEFPEVPKCFDKNIKAGKMSELLKLFESWKEQTDNRKLYTGEQAEHIVNACDNIIRILKMVNEVYDGESKAAWWDHGLINIKLSFQNKAALKRFADAWDKIAA